LTQEVQSLIKKNAAQITQINSRCLRGFHLCSISAC
jgi:hypothetical protein